MTTITTISRNETLPTTLELLGRTVFFIFLLTTSLVISSSSINLVILGAKINLVYVVFNFMVFFLPLTFSITLIIVFSFFAELLAGFPPGFFGTAPYGYPTYDQVVNKKNLYVVNVMIFFSFLVITGMLKIIIENVLCI